MSTFSTYQKIELIGTGEQSGVWGTTTNNNFSNVFEQALVGRVSVAFTDADVTLTATDTVNSQSFRRLYLNCTGANTANKNLIVPTINKTYVVQNNTTGGYSIVVKTTAGTGITVPNGKTVAVYADGTNVIQSFDHIPSLTLTTALPVASGGTGITSFGTGVATALGTNVGSAGAFVVNGGALGTPSSGTVTNLTGTASININGTVGATTPAAGTFTQVDITAQGDLRLQDTAGGEYVALQAPGVLASSYTLTFPVDDGTSGQVLTTDGNGVLSWTTNGSGDVVGPASSTDNAVVRFDGITGKLIQDSAVTIADTTGDITGGKYNKVTITTPATGSTLTIADGKTLTANKSLTLDGTDSTTMTFPGTSQTIAGLAVSGQTFTTAQTFRAANAIRSEAASTQDAIVVAGRAGGTSSYAATITPTTLTASRTVTIPDETFTVGFRNIPYTTDKTAAYTIATSDVGEVIGVGTGGSIEIPNSTFAAGDAVLIFNNTSAGITITCTITTAYIAGTDADKATVTLATRGVANILFISSTACVITGNVS